MMALSQQKRDPMTRSERSSIASIFLEPYSSLANDPMSVQIPIFSYGTQLSEEGNPPCARPGKDWRQF
nr:hypothetical protein BaRGS_004178 [Batillaria attramentaria]